eukprot:10356898-Alexandrium_andersonii.AAC.1
MLFAATGRTTAGSVVGAVARPRGTIAIIMVGAAAGHASGAAGGQPTAARVEAAVVATSRAP